MRFSWLRPSSRSRQSIHHHWRTRKLLLPKPCETDHLWLLQLSETHFTMRPAGVCGLPDHCLISTNIIVWCLDFHSQLPLMSGHLDQIGPAKEHLPLASTFMIIQNHVNFHRFWSFLLSLKPPPMCFSPGYPRPKRTSSFRTQQDPSPGQRFWLCWMRPFAFKAVELESNGWSSRNNVFWQVTRMQPLVIGVVSKISQIPSFTIIFPVKTEITIGLETDKPNWYTSRSNPVT